jgi:copper transport protein
VNRHSPAIRSPVTRGLVPFLLATVLSLALWALAPPAGAHSAFQRSDPAAGSLLKEAPAQVVIYFNQPIDPAFSNARLLDPQGAEVGGALGRVDPADPRILRMGLPDLTATGRYRVPWRVRAAGDGHVYGGELTFILEPEPSPAGGEAGPGEAPDETSPGSEADARSGGNLPAGRGAEPPPPLVLPTHIVAPAAVPIWVTAWPPAPETGLRWLGLLLLALAVGPYLFMAFQALGRGSGSGAGVSWTRALRWMVVVASLGLAGVTLAFTLNQAGAAAGVSWGEGLRGPVGDLLATSTGAWWATRAVLAVSLAVVALGLLRRWARAGASVVSALLLLTFSATSHASGHQAAILVPVDWLHLLAMVAWTGGLATLALLLADRRGRAEAAIVVRRFSLLALLSVGVLALTGSVATAVQAGDPAALLSSAWGRAFAMKLLLFAGLLGLGAVNRYFLIPRLRSGGEKASSGPARGERVSGRAAVGLRAVVVTEFALLAAVLVSVGVMTSSVPSAEADSLRRQTPLQQAFASDEVRAAVEIRDAGDALEILVSVEDLALGSGRALAETAAADTAVLAVVRDAGGSELRTVNLPTWDGRLFSARGQFFPRGEHWSLELVLKRQGQADVVQRLKMPPL